MCSVRFGRHNDYERQRKQREKKHSQHIVIQNCTNTRTLTEAAKTEDFMIITDDGCEYYGFCFERKSVLIFSPIDARYSNRMQTCHSCSDKSIGQSIIDTRVP